MIKVLILVATYLFSMNAMSDGLLRTTNLKSYCGQYDRQTVIYLDQGIISKKDPNWFKDILNKLKFLPGEQVQVVTINHGGSVVEEAWSGCYPALTEERYQKEKAQEGFTSLVTGGVDDKLKNDQKMFSKWLKQGLAAPLARTQHSDVPRYTESSFPIKKLVEALYYDAPRLDLKNGISRVILFSDMVEKSELVGDYSNSAEDTAKKVKKRYPAFFNHADFFVYGIKYTNDDSRINSWLEEFWRTYLGNSGAYIKSYSTQLVVPKAISSLKVHSYSGMITGKDGDKYSVQLRLGYDQSGLLAHSVYALDNEGYYLPLRGDFKCKGNNCVLTSVIESSNTEFFEKGYVLELKGSNKELSGIVGSKDPNVVDDRGNIYRYNVSLKLDSSLKL